MYHGHLTKLPAANMKIEYHPLQNSVSVTDKSGKEHLISCSRGSFEHVKDRAGGKFQIAKDVLKELERVIDEADKES